MATAKLGLNCVLYRNTGSYGSPNWVEVPNVKDLTLNSEMGEADVSTRGDGGQRITEPTLETASIEFQMVHDPTDAGFAAIAAAKAARTAIEFAVLDGSIETSTSEGLRATMKCFNFSRTENLEDAVMVSVTLKPSRADNPPEYGTVASGLFG